jgi:heme/copper-type cytochrome/quinol oxidase subunit 4
MQRLSIDILLAAVMAILPRVTGVGRMEAGRMLILACVYAAVAVLAYLRMFTPSAHRVAQLAFAVTLLLLGWLMSFPAWNHSGEIGLYLLFGSVVAAVSTEPWKKGMPFAL